MLKDRLQQQVQAFNHWKQQVGREFVAYRQWLRTHGLETEELEPRLREAAELIKADRILLAFVGEFSRGKSELINALLGKHYGQRLLPSRVGRTTMCPAELFFDPTATGAYIKLLPIHTRNDDLSLAEYKARPEHWVHMTINLDDPNAMKKAFQELSKARPVDKREAAMLGFEVQYLEPSLEHLDEVLIPAWRHALINIDHPLLRQGLAIIDTPGLNALGSEPELTLSLLPEAHALVFVLAADAGVTASDFQVWTEHVREIAGRRGAALYAVLNKVDMLWDDEDEDENRLANAAVDRLVKLTARQLGLPETHVLPISAKLGLRAQLQTDEDLLGLSGVPDLEELLAGSVIAAKQALLARTVLGELGRLMAESRQAVLGRLKTLDQERVAFGGKSKDVQYELAALSKHVQQEQAVYNKRLVLLQSSRRLIEGQLPQLLASVATERLQTHFQRARQAATAAKLGLGVPGAVTQYFQDLKQDLGVLAREVEATDGLIGRLYQKYAQEAQAEVTSYPGLEVGLYQQELAELERQAAPYKSRLGTMLGNHEKVLARFFDSLAREAAQVYQRARRDADRWVKEALAPIMQQTLAHKQQLTRQMDELKRLSGAADPAREALRLDQATAQGRRQIEELDEIRSRLELLAQQTVPV